MAFEAYLQQATARPRLGRRVTAVVSAIVHAVALAGAVAYSYWHVEELTPARVEVTLISAAAVPPPPPPPPPLGGGAATPQPKHRVARPKTELPKPDVVQPKVQPQEDPKPAPEPPKPDPTPDTTKGSGDAPPGPGDPNGTKGGVAGGVKGGTTGGVVDGTGTATVAAAPPAKFLPPAMGAQQKLSGADPEFPANLRRPGVTYVVLAKIVVNAAGMVESVTLQKRAEPTLDANVVEAVKKWRFRPLMANGKPIPFSYFGRFEFRSE